MEWETRVQRDSLNREVQVWSSRTAPGRPPSRPGGGALSRSIGEPDGLEVVRRHVVGDIPA